MGGIPSPFEEELSGADMVAAADGMSVRWRRWWCFL
jgi:hypothetical protein